jgi:hypothetical protein
MCEIRYNVFVQVTVNATDLFERYMFDSSYDDVIDPVLPTLEVTEVTIGQTIEVPLTNTHKVILSGAYLYNFYRPKIYYFK